MTRPRIAPDRRRSNAASRADRRWLAGIAAALLGAAPVTSAVAADAPDDHVVEWATADFPPGGIVRGPAAGTGYTQKVTAWIRERLPGYVLHESTLPLARLLVEAKAGRRLCSAGLLTSPERQAFLVFSEPLFWVLPNRLIVVAQRASEVADRRAGTGVHLAELAGLAPPLRLLVVRGRSYGAPIDAQLGVFRRTEVASTENTALLLKAGRVDATIGYVEELTWLQRGTDAPVDVVSFAIAGTAPMGAPIACTRGAWGDAVIAAINAVARSAKPGELQRFYNEWLDPGARRDVEQLTARAAAPAGSG